MKRIALHTAMFITVIFMIVMTVVPHHHHGATSCIAAEPCEKDGDVCHVRTSQSTEGSHSHGTCILGEMHLYIHSPQVSKHNLLQLLFFTPFLCAGARLPQPFFTKWKTVFYKVSFYIARWIDNVLGLRAPPTSRS